jgi:hypothetical protein
MTLLTGQVGVRAGQWEFAQVVIKRGILPIGRGMTETAIRTETAIVIVILPVT